MFFANSSLKQH